jgi:4-amino-4-deoxy-L-arabinose transferase-like glycosyltransferase
VRAATGLWILLGILWLASLPLRPMFDPDEGRYAEIPREMAASGDWVTPRLNDLKYLEKPPLQYWATAALYSAFGVHDWTARLWAVTLAFLCVPLVFAFAVRIGYSRDTALVAAALLAINPYFVLSGQINLLDQGFTLFLTVAVFSFVIAQREHADARRARNWMLVTWASLALAVLSKGIVTLVLAGATLLAYMAVTRDFSPMRRLQFKFGVPLFLIIAVPWFWLIQGRNPDFFHFFFIREHFERFLAATHEHVEPFWYFLPVLLVALLPVIGNVRHWSLRNIEGERKPGEFRAELFLLLWCAVVVALFSISQSKLASYVMPMMPPFAVVLARVTSSQASAFSRAKWISVGLMLLIAAGIVIASWQRVRSVPTSSIAWAAIVAVGCAIYLALERERSPSGTVRRWTSLAAISIAGYQLLALSYAAAFPARSASGLASEFVGTISADTHLYSVGQYRHSLAFYLRRPLAVYDYVGELEFGMQQAQVTSAARNREQFLAHWQTETHAIAFIDFSVYAALRAAGMPGRIVARDARSIVVARL